MTETVRRYFSGMRAKATDPKGDVEIMFAIYGKPDDSIPVGVEERQVIDQGALSTFIARTNFGKDPVSFFADHGDAAQLFGAPSPKATMKIGHATEIVETEGGAVARGRYNLSTQLGQEMFSWLDPEWRDSTQFSFSNPLEGMVVSRQQDGFEHVLSIPSVDEISQVGFGAQEGAHVIAARSAAMRAAIGSHSTATTSDSWDAGANTGRLSNDSGAATFRKEYAWVDSGADPDTKAAYKFPHHMVSADGAPGAANTNACSSAIGSLNGGRGGADIPASDRTGVHAHLAKHMRDAGMDVPELRMAAEADVAARAISDCMAHDAEWLLSNPILREALAAKLLRDRAFARDVKRAAESALEPDAVDQFLADAFRMVR